MAQRPAAPMTDEPGPALARAKRLADLAFSGDVGASATLKQALSDENWYVRGEAARALGRLGDKSAAPLLQPLLKDQNWFVRAASLEAIGALSMSDVDISAPFDDTDAYIRARAMTSFGARASGNSSSIRSLIKGLSDREPLVRRASANALGELKVSSAVDALLVLLKEDDESLRRASVVALGRIGDKRAANAVRDVASEAGPDQWEYAAALYRLGDTESLDRVTAALASDYADVRRNALKALLEFRDDRALPALLPLTQSTGTGSTRDGVGIRVDLANGLVGFSNQQARAALINLLDDPEAIVRAASVASISKVCREQTKNDFPDRALAALIRALKKENAPIVIKAISDSLETFDRARVTDVLLDSRNADGRLSPNIEKALIAAGVTAETQSAQLAAGDVADRIRAAERLARLGDTKAVLPLIDTLAGAKEIALRVKAAEALGSLRDKRAVDALVVAAAAQQPELRVAAVSALGLIGDHLAAEALFAAIGDAQPAVRDAAIVSLSALGISVEKVAPDLSSSSWQVRAAAVATLARLGDRSAVPLLVSALRDADSRVRSEAARTLGQYADQTATDALIAALRDQSADVRVEATFSLGRLKEARALGPLASLLNDRDPRVSLAAAESLARLRDPRATRVLIDSLSNADWRVRSRATQVLARVAADGSLDQAVGPLARALADDDPVVRYYAAEALIGIGAKGVPALIEILRSHREADRDRAARVLWRIGAPAVDPLIAILQERNSTAETRASAAHTLGLIGDGRAIKGLATMLSDDRYFVRQQAARALGLMGAPALDLLFEMARSSTPAIREAAIEALGNSNSARAIDRVIEALADSNLNVRAAAVRALGESSSENVVPHLMTLLRDESSTFRAQAAASLAKLGGVALPGLIRALKDPKPSVRQLAAEALGSIGSRDAVAPLIELVTTDQSGARPEAIEALGKIGDPAAVAPILAVMRTGSVAVRKRAVVALAGFREPRVQEALTGALTDANEEVRQFAASGLGEIGDERTIPKLERLADNDASSDVRSAAVQAIERIRKDPKSHVKPEDHKLSRP